MPESITLYAIKGSMSEATTTHAILAYMLMM